MTRAILAAIRSLLVGSRTQGDTIWSSRFLPSDLQQSNCDRCRFNPVRDFCW